MLLRCGLWLLLTYLMSHFACWHFLSIFKKSDELAPISRLDLMFIAVIFLNFIKSLVCQIEDQINQPWWDLNVEATFLQGAFNITLFVFLTLNQSFNFALGFQLFNLCNSFLFKFSIDSFLCNLAFNRQIFTFIKFYVFTVSNPLVNISNFLRVRSVFQ